MPRPRHFRRVGCLPQSNYFKPRGVPLAVLQCVNLTVDEIEAVRLADLGGLYQEEAAKKMKVSRQTFGRIIESAHKKIADALVNGKALSIDGGPVEMAPGVEVPPGFFPPAGPGGIGPGGQGRRRGRRRGRHRQG
ncbi:MAG: hypothetical protein DRP65_05000 [Planctomycetota bacterium]|nr:MAG: hypothetical protein DRP65_05000 [Planctomycetota bacterium]